MKFSRNFFLLIASLLLSGASVSAQALSDTELLSGASVSAQALSDTEEFNKDGLSFKYPSGWSFNDTSNADAQQMIFGKADSDAQMTVFVYRAPLTTPEKIAEAKKVLVDKYIASTTKSFEQANARPESSASTSEIGTVKSEGVKIHASLDGVPGIAEIQWAVVDQRLVVLTLLGPDKALQKARSVWDTIRNTIRIEGPTPQPKPSPAQ